MSPADPCHSPHDFDALVRRDLRDHGHHVGKQLCRNCDHDVERRPYSNLDLRGFQCGRVHGLPGQDRDAHLSQGHDEPAGQDHDALAGQDHDTPASRDHDAPAGRDHDTPASRDHGAPAGLDQGPFRDEQRARLDSSDLVRVLLDDHQVHRVVPLPRADQQVQGAQPFG